MPIKLSYHKDTSKFNEISRSLSILIHNIKLLYEKCSQIFPILGKCKIKISWRKIDGTLCIKMNTLQVMCTMDNITLNLIFPNKKIL